MSGNHRMDAGDIAQSKLKGKAMEDALDKAFDNEAPHPYEHNGPNVKKHGRLNNN